VAFTNINNSYVKDLHDHDFYEYFLVVAGTGEHLVPSGPYKITQGDLVFIAAEHRHSIRAQDLDIINIAFPRSVWAPATAISPELTAIFATDEPQCVRTSQAQRERFLYWAHELDPQRDQALAVQAMLFDVLRAGNSAEVETHAPHWLREALDEISRPPFLSEGMSALVEISQRSREYIWRSCRQAYGKSPQELINQMRMHYAEQALRLSNASILHICYDCGLSNVSHFYRMFRKSYGMTPKQYRLSHARAVT
jgi:AraC family cel operon transcriptional repressor